MVKTLLRGVGAAEMGHGRGRVLAHAIGGGLFDVGPELEVIVAAVEPGASSEVVDRDSVIPLLGEAQCQFLVERVQPADIGQHHHGRPRSWSRCMEGSQLGPIRSGQRDVPMVDRRTGDAGKWRRGIEIEAQAGHLLGRRDARYSLVLFLVPGGSLLVPRGLFLWLRPQDSQGEWAELKARSVPCGHVGCLAGRAVRWCPFPRCSSIVAEVVPSGRNPPLPAAQAVSSLQGVAFSDTCDTSKGGGTGKARGVGV